MSDRANDPSSAGHSYEASGLPPGLSINPSTGVIAGVVGLAEGGPGLPRPDAIIGDGVPLPSPDPARAADDSAAGRVTFTAILPPGVCIDGGCLDPEPPGTPDHPPPQSPPPPPPS